jgi:hypothetical protein
MRSPIFIGAGYKTLLYQDHKGQDTIMACNRLAVLHGLWTDAEGLINEKKGYGSTSLPVHRFA